MVKNWPNVLPTKVRKIMNTAENTNDSSNTPGSVFSLPNVGLTQTERFAQEQAAAKRAAEQALTFTSKEFEIGASEKMTVNLAAEQITTVISKSSEMSGNMKTKE